jgi:hypothetical protein
MAVPRARRVACLSKQPLQIETRTSSWRGGDVMRQQLQTEKAYIIYLLILYLTTLKYEDAGHGTERSKACTVFARSEAGIVGSNPTQGMDV